jgi:thiamine pyrophosphokinase
LEAARRAGVHIERHPTDKDATDLELGLARAVELGATRVVVVGMAGGRLDHLLANVAVLGSPSWPAVTIEARLGDARVHVVRGRSGAPGPPGELTLLGRPGQVVTLLALHGPASGVCTSGLRYPLADATLPPGSTRGVSNEFVASSAVVEVASGVLLVIVPDGAEPLLLPTDPGGLR